MKFYYPVAGLLATVASIAILTSAAKHPEPALERSSVASELSVDPVHSNVLFKIKHNNAAFFYGRFGDISGSIQFDEEDASNCGVQISIKSASVDARNAKLDQHLRSPDFFDVVQFPSIDFKSKSVEQIDEHKYEVKGDLSLHGVTKAISFEMQHTGTGQGGKVVGFHTTFSIDRSEYGMSYGVGGPLGKDVELIISIESKAK
jgi:polyisoprenoid-binding protein YceI